MAINRTKAIGDAPARGPKQRGGRRKGDFLVSRGMTPQASGEESRQSAVASQAIEAQPSFGQIKPKERLQWSHWVGQHRQQGEVALAQTSAQEVRRSRRRKRSNRKQMAGRRIAGFLMDNDSNACHGALRESPKGSAR